MKKLVYIIEDNPVQQKVLKVHFEETLGDYIVKVFPTAKDLFGNLAEMPYAVLLDHYLQDGTNNTGLDYLKELKKYHPSLPVIYYTTLNDAEVKKQAANLGVEDYIVKDGASLVRLRTALDLIEEKSKKKGLFQKLFGKK